MTTKQDLIEQLIALEARITNNESLDTFVDEVFNLLDTAIKCYPKTSSDDDLKGLFKTWFATGQQNRRNAAFDVVDELLPITLAYRLLTSGLPGVTSFGKHPAWFEFQNRYKNIIVC